MIGYAFGDSHSGSYLRIVNTPVDDQAELFPYYLAKKTGCELHSYATAGAMATIDRREPGGFIPGAIHQASFCTQPARWASIFFGTNDLILPVLRWQQQGLPPVTDFSSQLNAIALNAAEKISAAARIAIAAKVQRVFVLQIFSLPDTPIMAQTLPPEYRTVLGAACWTLNQALEPLRTDRRIALIDVEGLKRSRAGTAWIDDYHFNFGMHRAIADLMFQFL